MRSMCPAGALPTSVCLSVRLHLLCVLLVMSYVLCHYRRKGKYFKMEVLSKSGQLLPPKGIRDKLEKIMEMAGGKL